jgi:hypothetical protein
MYTYTELKQMLEEAKTEIQKQIAATLIQAPKPMSAAEIAEVCNCPIGTVSYYAGYDDEYADAYCKALGYKIKYETRETYQRYVNPENPNDTISVCRKRIYYWAERIK